MFNPHLKISTNEIPGPYDVPGEFFRITKEEIIPLLHEFFQRIEKEETIPSTFYEASVTSITKPHKDSDFCLSCSLLCRQCLQGCLACDRCSVGVYGRKE